MVKLTDKDIIHVAKLAKLKLKQKEIKKFKEQLSSVINYIHDLSKVDILGVEPTSQTTNLLNIKRQDKIDSQPSLTTEEALSGSEDTHSGYFKVPGILEKDI